MKKLLCVILCLVCCIPFSGCKSKETDGLKEDWYVVSNMQKVRRDETITEGKRAGIRLEMAKNEYEGAQIVFRADSDTTFNAVVSADLVGAGGARILKENVSLYAEHYINVEQPTTTLPSGYYPDALVPMERYLANRDNKVSKGNNQGIYMSVRTNERTPAGVYTGAVRLIVGNSYEDIPLSVTVWDFALSQTNHSKTAYTLWNGTMIGTQDMLLAGEFDSSEEMTKTYYEFFLKYRITPTFLPTYEYGDNARYVEVMKEYAARDEVSGYALNFDISLIDPSNDALGWVVDKAKLKATMRAMVTGSTAELDLFKKAYLYISIVDEPRAEQDFNRVKICDRILREVKEELLADVTLAEYFDAVPTLRDSLQNVQHVVTTHYTEELAGYIDTFCPTVDYYDSPEYRSNVSQADNGQWWYTCQTPKNPYPSYHIDDNLISARQKKWMQMKYNVEGELYWAVNIFRKFDGSAYVERDVWNDPICFVHPDQAVGDGYLVYPGKKYDVDGPISTIRLETIRDGQEDYEYYYLLKTLLEEKREQYGLTVDVNEYIAGLYDTIFSGTRGNTDMEAMTEARRELAQQILALQSSAETLAVVGKTRTEADGSKVKLSVYAKAGSTVKINGESVTGEGVLHTKDVTLSGTENRAEIQVTNDGKTVTYTRWLGGEVRLLSGAESQSDLARFITANGDTATQLSLNANTQYVSEGQSSLKIDLDERSATTRYVSFRLAEDGNPVDFTGTKRITFDIWNAGAENVTIPISLINVSYSEIAIGSCYVEAGGHATVTLNFPAGVELSAIRYIQFNLPKVGADQIVRNSFTMYLDNLSVEK